VANQWINKFESRSSRNPADSLVVRRKLTFDKSTRCFSVHASEISPLKSLTMKNLTTKYLMKSPSLFSAAAVLPLTVSLVSCATAQDKNSGEMITNPGFEITQSGAPTGWTLPGLITTLSPVSKTGANSLKFQVSDAGYAPYVGQSIFGYKANQLLQLKYNVRTDRPGVEYRIYTEFWAAGLGNVASYNGEWLQGSGAWQDISAIFKTPAVSDRLGVVLQVRGPGTAWVDNISVKPINPVVGETAPVPSGPVATPSAQAGVGVEPGVRITADRRFVKDGRPFFPIKIWGWWPQSEGMMKDAHDFGYNVVCAPGFAGGGPSSARAWLDAAQRQKIYAMPQMGFGMPANDTAEAVLAAKIEAAEKIIPVLRDHPAVFAYHFIDEPALGRYDVATNNKAAQWLKAQDPNHPIHINHAPANTIAEIRQYNPYIDIVGSDIYAVRFDGIGYHSDLPNKTLSIVGDETRKNLEAVDYKKPAMQALQGFIWHPDDKKPKPFPTVFPTRHESRFMAWDSIVAGATAISWFQNEQYPYLYPDLKPVVREFAALQDVLAGGKMVATKGVFASPIQSIAYQWKGKTVLIAINPSKAPAKLAANWKSAFGQSKAPSRVLWENRKVAATETFKPYDVHVYTDAATDKEILRTEFAVDPIKP
jgi:hypothetical protein